MFAPCDYLSVRVISWKALREFGTKHAAAQTPLDHWYRIALKATWATLNDVRVDFPSADFVAPVYTVFNIGGNNFRLIVKMEYALGRIYILHVFTHREYDRWKG